MFEIEPQEQTTSRASPVREALIAARKLIERPEDWAQGGRVTGGGPRCAFTAINDVCRRDEFRWAASLRDMLGAFNDTTNDIITFNDSHSHAEVLAAFDKAIEGCA